MSLGQCRYCQYSPVATDAIVCPRCGGAAPNPSTVTKAWGWFNTVVGCLVMIVVALLLIATVVVAVLTNS
jgi:hypothetical protein